MKVKVTRCPDGEFWYSKYIGEIIEVVECYDYDSDDHRVVDWQRYDDDNDTVGLFIRRQDCEEVTMAEAKEFKVGDEVVVVKNLNIERWEYRPSIGAKGVVKVLNSFGYGKPMVGVILAM